MKKMYKRSWLMLLLAFVLALAVACGGDAAPTVEEPAVPAAEEPAAPAPADEEMAEEVSDRCGDRSRLAASINFFNWGDYMDEDIMDQFEEECGVRVNQDIFSSNEDMIARIQAGNSGYDLIVPSDYAVQILVERGLLHEIDRATLTNYENLNPNLLGLYYDPDNTYSIPYQWGTTGIAYNMAYLDEHVDSWATILDPDLACQHRGFISLLDDEREAVGAALKYLGYSYNDSNPDHHAEARELLIAQKECLAGYDSDNYSGTLAGEEVVMALAWSGGTAVARSENENVFFVIPQEGGAIWMDNLAIPSDAPNPYTAEVFINYLLDAEIGAQLSNYTYYFTPNEAAEPLLDDEYFEILEAGGMIVTDEVYDRLEWIERDDETIIFSDTWTAVKAR
ncbi:MAG: spermidine/putrescine ABC transporter substrate-binding protein [Chloroflexota bacterium]